MRPDDPEVLRFVARARVARIATVSRHGRPHVNPLWFVWRDGRVHLGTGEETLAARNVRANPHAALLFTVEHHPEPRDANRVLRMHGPARVVPAGRFPPWWYAFETGRRYYFSLDGLRTTLAHLRQLPLMRDYYSPYLGAGSCLIEVTPQDAEFLRAPETRAPASA